MNQVFLMGRLTKDPEVRYSRGANSIAIARYTLAVDRRFRRDQDGDQGQSADFINIVAFDRAGEFAEKYFRKGMRVLVSRREAMKRATAIRFIRRMLLPRHRNLQKGEEGIPPFPLETQIPVMNL